MVEIVFGSITAWMERYPGSRKPRYTTKPHRATNPTQEINWEGKIQEVVASVQERNSSNLNRTQGSYRVSWEVGGNFQGGDWWDF